MASEVRRRDRRFLARGSDPEDLEVVKAKGTFVLDARGRRSIDFITGWCVGNLGWANAEIEDAIRDFRGPNYVAPWHLYAPWAELAELLVSIAPGKLKKCIRTATGTESVEAALQAARVHTKRDKFLALEDSYHGNSIAVNDIPRKVPPPTDHRAVDRLETQLKRREIAAFILEPIPCNLGVLIFEKDVMQRVQQLCRKYGTLLIADEVADGFGRTGTLFACERYDLQPDILCLAKSITGGYAPMGATLVTESVARSLKDMELYSTYGWHPLSVAAALANIRYIIKHRQKLLGNANAVGNYIRDRLVQMEFDKVRAAGMAIGADRRNAGDAIDRCRKKGLLLTGDDGTLTLFPPLNTTMKTARTAMDILASVMP